MARILQRTIGTYIGDSDSNPFFVDAVNDRVGVGTSNPSERLTVVGDGSDGTISVRNASNEERAKLFYGGSDYGLVQLFKSDNSVGTIIRGSGDSYFNGGNVGIGTSSPDTNVHISDAAGSSIAEMLRIQNTTAGYGSALAHLPPATLWMGHPARRVVYVYCLRYPSTEL